MTDSEHAVGGFHFINESLARLVHRFERIGWLIILGLGCLIGSGMITKWLMVAVAATLFACLGRWFAYPLVRKRTLMISLLVFSLALTRLRQDIGVIILEPWQIATALCFGVWGLEVACGRCSRVYRLDRLGVLALLVVAGAILSLFGALDVPIWFKRSIRVLGLFGMYWYLVQNVRQSSQVAAMIRAGLWACALTGVVMLVQFAGLVRRGEISLYVLSDTGVRGTFANGNEAGTFLVIFLVIAAAFHYSRARAFLMRRTAFSLVVGLTALGLVISQSRTAALIVGILCALLFARNVRFLRFVAMAVLVLALSWPLPMTQFFAGRLLASVGLSGEQSYDRYVQASTSTRLFLWRVYLEVVRTHPVFGIGAGNYGLIEKMDIRMPQVGSDVPFDPNFYLGASAHNGFLNWWAETGTIGLLSFLLTLVYAGWLLLGLFRERDVSNSWRAMSLGGAGALGAFILTNFTGDFGVSEPRYWFLLALTSILIRLRREQDSLCIASPTPPTPGISAARTTV